MLFMLSRLERAHRQTGSLGGFGCKPHFEIVGGNLTTSKFDFLKTLKGSHERKANK